MRSKREKCYFGWLKGILGRKEDIQEEHSSRIWSILGPNDGGNPFVDVITLGASPRAYVAKGAKVKAVAYVQLGGGSNANSDSSRRILTEVT